MLAAIEVVEDGGIDDSGGEPGKRRERTGEMRGEWCGWVGRQIRDFCKKV